MKATRKKNYYIFVHTLHVNNKDFVVKFASNKTIVFIQRVENTYKNIKSV